MRMSPMAATPATTPPITAAGWDCVAADEEEDEDELSSADETAGEEAADAGVPVNVPVNVPSEVIEGLTVAELDDNPVARDAVPEDRPDDNEFVTEDEAGGIPVELVTMAESAFVVVGDTTGGVDDVDGACGGA